MVLERISQTRRRSKVVWKLENVAGRNDTTTRQTTPMMSWWSKCAKSCALVTFPLEEHPHTVPSQTRYTRDNGRGLNTHSWRSRAIRYKSHVECQDRKQSSNCRMQAQDNLGNFVPRKRLSMRVSTTPTNNSKKNTLSIQQPATKPRATPFTFLGNRSALNIEMTITMRTTSKDKTR